MFFFLPLTLREKRKREKNKTWQQATWATETTQGVCMPAQGGCTIKLSETQALTWGRQNRIDKGEEHVSESLFGEWRLWEHMASDSERLWRTKRADLWVRAVRARKRRLDWPPPIQRWPQRSAPRDFIRLEVEPSLGWRNRRMPSSIWGMSRHYRTSTSGERPYRRGFTRRCGYVLNNAQCTT